MWLEYGAGAKIPDIPIWPLLFSASVGLIVFAYVLWRWSNPTTHAAKYLYAINVTAVVICLYVRDGYYAAALPNWFPFQAHKLGCFVSALLSPSFVVGLYGISLHAGSAVVKIMALSPEIVAHFNGVEPWASFAFGLGGILTLVFRFLRFDLENQIIRANAEVRINREFAATVLRMKDLMNSPLQALELATSILRKDSSGKQEVVDTIEQSVERLRSINTEMSKFEIHGQWEGES